MESQLITFSSTRITNCFACSTNFMKLLAHLHTTESCCSWSWENSVFWLELFFLHIVSALAIRLSAEDVVREKTMFLSQKRKSSGSCSHPRGRLVFIHLILLRWFAIYIFFLNRFHLSDGTYPSLGLCTYSIVSSCIHISVGFLSRQHYTRLRLYHIYRKRSPTYVFLL